MNAAAKCIASIALALLALAGPAAAGTIHVVALGTSFTYGKGLLRTQAYPAQLAQKLRAAGQDVVIDNQGIDGNSTDDLARRLDSAVPADTAIVLLEYALGNDRKSGIDKPQTIHNVQAIIARLLARRIEVLLVVRGRNPDALETRLSWFMPTIRKTGIAYIAINQPRSTLQDDAQHPTAAAAAQIAASMVAPVTGLIAKASAASH